MPLQVSVSLEKGAGLFFVRNKGTGAHEVRHKETTLAEGQTHGHHGSFAEKPETLTSLRHNVDGTGVKTNCASQSCRGVFQSSGRLLLVWYNVFL